MSIHLVNPSHLSFGTGVITPRWLFVLAAATPTSHGDPLLTDETLEPFDEDSVRPGDVVGVGIHTGNAHRGYEVGTLARGRGAAVIFGGVHATRHPDEAQRLGGAHAVIRGDGDLVWPRVLDDAARGALKPVYEAGPVAADYAVPARWDLLPIGRYTWGSVRTICGGSNRGVSRSGGRTDDDMPRSRRLDAVIDEIMELRRRGVRFIALADDNFYPVASADRAMGRKQGSAAGDEHVRLRAERADLLRRLSALPPDIVFVTAITIEAAKDHAFLDAMRRANIKGVLVGVEAGPQDGLKDIVHGSDMVAEAVAAGLLTFRHHGMHVLGSFVVGPSSERPSTAATGDATDRAWPVWLRS